jgi:polyisoprenoid-binding protein YceI
MKTIRNISLSVGILLGGAIGAHASDAYKIDPAHSVVSFGIHHFIGVTKGKFARVSGTLELDREHPEHSSVSVQVPVQSIDTGIRKRDDHLRSDEFFDVAKYPQVTFKSRSVKQTGPQAGDVTGDLTMHGVTRLVTLHVKLLTSKAAQESSSSLRWAVTMEPLKRREFNLMFSNTAEAISGIGQDVSVNMEIETIKGE